MVSLPQMAESDALDNKASVTRTEHGHFQPGHHMGRPPKGETLRDKFEAMLEGKAPALIAALESQLLKGNGRIWDLALAHYWGQPKRTDQGQLAEDDPALLLAKHLAQAIENGTEAALLRVKAEQAEMVPVKVKKRRKKPDAKAGV